MPRQRPDNNDERANERRDRLQEQAAGFRPGREPHGQDKPMRVELVSGHDAFFSKMAETLGFTRQHAGSTGNRGFADLISSMEKVSRSSERSAQQMERSLDQLRAMVGTQRARDAAQNEYSAELKATTQALRDLRGSLGSTLRAGHAVPSVGPEEPPRREGGAYHSSRRYHRRDDEDEFDRHTRALPDLDQPGFPSVSRPPPRKPDGPEGGGGRGGGRGGGDAIRVEVVRGHREFIDQLTRALGGGSGGAGGGSGPSPHGSQPNNQRRTDRAARQATELRAHVTSYTPGAGRLQYNPQRHNLGDYRRAAYAHAGEYIHQRWGQGDTRSPTAYAVNDPHTGDFVGYRYSYQGQHWNMATGQVAANAEEATVRPGEAGFDEAQQAAKKGEGISGMAETLGGVGLTAGLKAIPGVGTGIAAALTIGKAANEGMEWLTNQRAANTRYQSIYGATNDQNVGWGGGLGDLGSFIRGDSSDSRTGLGNRLAEQGYVYANRFGINGLALDETSARTLFRGVSNMGFTGSTRGDMMSVSADLYRDQGVPVEQSLKWLNVATQQTGSNLNGMVQAFDAVSKAAEQTNQNANELRNTLIGNYQNLTPQFGIGAGGLAQALTMETQGVTRAWSGVSDAGQLSNPVSGSLIAQRAGYSGMGAMEAAAMSGKTGGILAAQGQFNSEVMRSVLPQSAKAAMDAFAQSRGGVKAVMASPGELNALGQEGLRALGNIPPTLLRQSAARFGVQIDESTNDADMMAKLWSYTVGGGPGGANAPGQQTENRGVKLTGDALDAFLGADVGSTGGFGGGPGGMALKSAAAKGEKAGGAGEDQIQGAIESYQDVVKGHGGVTSPTISKLIDELGTDENTGIMVSTAKGNKVMSVQDAIKYAPDQVASGNAIVVGGKHDGKKVSEVAGQDTNLSGAYGDSNQMAADTGDGTKTGKAADVMNQWKKEHTSDQTPGGNKAGSVGGGKITLDLTDAAKQLVSPSTSGNVNYSNSVGTVPAPVGGPLK